MLNAIKILARKEQAGEKTFKTPAGTGTATLQRYKKAQCECIKFDGIIMRLYAKYPTGASSHNVFIRAANAVLIWRQISGACTPVF